MGYTGCKSCDATGFHTCTCNVQRHRGEYVDTRGTWPTYVNNQLAISLEGKPRNISLADAREVAGTLLERKF